MASLARLKTVLQSADGTQEGVKKACDEIMKFYSSTGGSCSSAVVVWKECITRGNASSDKLMTLLYVANDALQTSKRKR
jgi:hypothetical protein